MTMGRRKRKLLLFAVLLLCGTGAALLYWKIVAAPLAAVAAVRSELMTGVVSEAVVVVPAHASTTECDELMTRTVSAACAQYATRYIDGNFCPRLCSKHEFETLRCLNGGDSDKLVILLWARGGNPHKLVLKRTVSESQVDEHLLEMKSNVFVSLVNETLRRNLGTPLGANLDDELDELDKLWTLKTSDFMHETARQQILFTSLWPLLQQTEYLNCKYFEKQRLFPRIEGSCGAIYFAEYISSSPTKAIYSKWTWDVTAQYIMKLIDFILRLDDVYKEQIHLCDVKDEHFRLDTDDNIVFIDSDMVHTHSRLATIFVNSDCTANEHCDYFDCHGECNPQTNKCMENRTNTNMQALAAKILLDSTGPGLLDKAPHSIRSRLLEISVELRQHPYGADELRRALSPLQLILTNGMEK